jgi:hypothetical protein
MVDRDLYDDERFFVWHECSPRRVAVCSTYTLVEFRSMN